MYKAAEAGAKAVSFEFLFLDSAPTTRQKIMYNHMFKAMGDPKFGQKWNSMSKSVEACRRGSREYKFDMTMKIRELAHELGMVFGCSDPHFKEYNDTGSCCGIKPDDPIFGGWSRRQLTNVIVEMRDAYDRGENRRMTYLDWAPEWAHKVNAVEMYNCGNWHSKRVRKHFTFGDAMRNKWNAPKAPRSPYVYFSGVMRPVGIDQRDDVVYEYRDWHKGFDQEFKGELNEEFNYDDRKESK